jgi:hypothetical protein
MRKRPGVKVLADLADEAAVGIELPQLGGGIGEGRPVARSATVEDENVALGIDRDAGRLAHIEIGRQLEEIGHRVVGDERGRLLRRLLGHGGRAQQRDNGEQKVLHRVLP